jgi:hypothetical protein
MIVEEGHASVSHPTGVLMLTLLSPQYRHTVVKTVVEGFVSGKLKVTFISVIPRSFARVGLGVSNTGHMPTLLSIFVACTLLRGIHNHTSMEV